MSMTEYTKWWIKYPWHVTTRMEVPEDCKCGYCQEKEKQGTSQFHCKKCGKTEKRAGIEGKVIFSEGLCADCLEKRQ